MMILGVNAYPAGDDEVLLGSRRRRLHAGADEMEVGYDAQDSAGLRVRWRCSLVRRFRGRLLPTARRARRSGLIRLRVFPRP